MFHDPAPPKLAARRILAAGLTCVAVCFVFHAWLYRSLLRAVVHESGDAGANSLLVLKAKAFELLVGNYSRVGFNHPGPALMYVLAAGEALFHDLLGVTASPVMGQVLVIGLYNGVWIALAGWLLHLLGRSASFAVTALILFFALSVYMESGVFGGIWFPYLYYFPFAAFTLALAVLSTGRAAALPVLVLSGGFLVHGHVSFVAIIGIMTTAALLANAAMSWQRVHGVQSVFNRSWWRQHARVAWAATIVLALFVLPIALETWINYPGQLYSYLTYSQGNKGHPIGPALAYVSSYWAVGSVSLLMATVLVASLVAPALSQSLRLDRGHAVGLGVALTGATAAFLFYAAVGIDDYSHKYVGIFYLACPALLLSVILASWMHPASLSNRAMAVLACIVLAGVLGWSAARVKKQPPSHDLQSTEVAGLANAIRTAGPGTAILNLDNSENWTNVWLTMTGASTYLTRRNENNFCIHVNWHVSFTKRLQCTPAQLATGATYLVTAAAAARASPTPDTVYRSGTLALVRTRPVPLVQNQFLPVSDATRVRLASTILGEGWSGIEPEFVWSLGSKSTLELLMAPPGPVRLTLDLAAFLPDPQARQSIEVQVNGRDVGTGEFTSADNRRKRSWLIPAQLVPSSGQLKVQIKIASPRSPMSAGQSKDSRLLGVALYGLGIETP